MHKIILFLFFSSTLSFGQNVFRESMDAFKKDYEYFYNRRIPDVSIYHCDTSRKHNAIALCKFSDHSIEIYPFFYGYNKEQQIVIMYHELGHCVLNLRHYPVKKGVHIMNEYIDYKNFVEILTNFDYYKTKLFSDGYFTTHHNIEKYEDWRNKKCKKIKY